MPLNRFAVFLSLFFQVTRLWGGLMVIFSGARFFYLFYYRKVLENDQYATWDLPYALISALRFDSAVAAHLLMPMLAAAVLVSLLQRAVSGFDRALFLRRCHHFLLFCGVIVMAIVVMLAIGDHFFYIYFRDHFNVFFWEFWENVDNANLVVGGLGDAVPLWHVAFLIIFALGFVIWYAKSFLTADKVFVPNWAQRLSLTTSGRRWLSVIIALAVILATRATFQARPLVLQAKHTAMSASNFVNLLHNNFMVSMYHGYADRVDVVDGRGRAGVDEQTLERDFAFLEKYIPAAKAIRSPKGYWFLEQSVMPRAHQWIKKKPKHVVVIFMESYSKWVMTYPDRGFSQALSRNMQAIQERSLSFGHHFSSGGGTIKNVANALMGFPQPRNFSPSVNYHSEGLKPFPSVFTRVMAEQGFKPEFFYGGEINWHRLYQFLPIIGFRDFYAEHSFQGFERHKYGLYDRDLLQGLHERLIVAHQATEKLFAFTLTLSNHPPFNVPKEWDSDDVQIPSEIASRLIDDRDQLRRRINGFRYADWSLGEFFAKAATAPYFSDTLFVITGDHPFGGSISYPSTYGWKEEEIPLLFFGPDIIQDKWQGRELKPFSTHLDLIPTVLSLVTDQKTTIHSFGKNLLEPDLPELTGTNFYFSCEEGYCLKKGKVSKLNADYLFEEVQSESVEREKMQKIASAEKSLYNAALHYLFSFQP